MASVTLSVSEEFKQELKHFLWVNWSEIAREEVMKKIIFEKYLQTKQISDEDWGFCEKIDWHPVDEFPIKKEYLQKLEKIRQGEVIKYRSVSDLFK